MKPSFALAFAGLLASSALAQEMDEHVFVAGPLTIEHPWVRAAAAGGETLAFTEIINVGAPDTLLGASSPAAGSVEIVGLVIDGGAIVMAPIGPIEVPTGAFTFDPGGLGLALRDLVADLVEGTEIEVTLTFATAGAVAIHVLVEAAGAMAHSHAH